MLLRWKERYSRWSCLCVWPAAPITEDTFRRTVLGMIYAGDLVRNPKEIVIRRFTQMNGKSRFEVFVESDDELEDVKYAIENKFSGWHCRQHVAVEQRANRKPRRKKKHQGRFAIMSWNVDGLGSKFHQARIVLDKVRPTIIAFQETMRKKRVWQQNDQDFRIGAFHGFELKVDAVGSKARRRGMALAIDSRANLSMEKIECPDDDEGREEANFLFGRVSGFASNSKLIVGNVYIPRQGKPAALRRLKRAIDRIHERFPQDKMVLVGDWNWSRAQMVKKLVSLKADIDLLLADVKDPKSFHEYGKPVSDIDHAVVQEGLAFPKIRILRRHMQSDHWPLLAKWGKEACIKLEDTSSKRKPLRMVPHRVNAVVEEIANHQTFKDFANDVSLQDVNGGRVFNEACIKVAKELKTTTGGQDKDEVLEARPVNMISAHLDKKSRRRASTLRRLMRTQAIKPTKKRWKEIRRLRRLVRKALEKAAKANRYRWLRGFHEAKTNSDPVEMFNWINGAAGVERGHANAGKSGIRDEKGQMVTDPEKVASMWAKFFSEQAKDTNGMSKDYEYWSKYLPDRVKRMADDMQHLNWDELGGKPVPSSVEGFPNLDEMRKNMWRPNQPREFSQKTEMWDDGRGDEARAIDLARRRLLLDSLSDEILMDEIVEYLRKSARRKSPGLDGITNEFLRAALFEFDSTKGASSALLKCLCDLLNYAWKNSVVFEEWKNAVVVPVPKKGDLTVMDNYRGIALMPSTLKVINTILSDRIMRKVRQYRLLNPGQCGFVSKEEAVGQAAALMELADSRRIRGLDTYILYVDFAKAYDSVPHGALLMKLEKFGISGRALMWIRGLYADAKICCRRSDGGFSESYSYDRGVRQGDPLSSILFDIFIDDLINDTMKGVELVGNEFDEPIRVPSMLFADDVALIAPTEKRMKQLANTLSTWSNENGMKVNISKCGLMHVPAREKPVVKAKINKKLSKKMPILRSIVVDVSSRSKKGEPTDESDPRLRRRKIKIQGQVVPRVMSYTYLGIEMTPTLNKKAIVLKRVDVGRAVIAKYAKLLSSPVIPLEAKSTCIRAIIQPTVTYGAEIWGGAKTQAHLVDKVVMEAIRLAMRLPKNASRFMAFKELNVVRASVIGAKAKMRLWFKTQVLQSYLPLIRQQLRWKRSGMAAHLWWITRDQRWIDRIDLFRLVCDRQDMLRDKIEAIEKIPRFLRSDKNVEDLKRLRGKLENVIPTMIKSIANDVMGHKPNQSSKNEMRYVGKHGAELTRSIVHGLSSTHTELAYGVTVLVRLRMARYWTAKRLAKVGLIEEEFGERCPFCDEETPETEAHMIFKCERWQHAYDEHLARLPHPLNKALIGLAPLSKVYIACLAGLDVVRIDGLCGDELMANRMMSTVLEGADEPRKAWWVETAAALCRFLQVVSPSRFRALKFIPRD